MQLARQRVTDFDPIASVNLDGGARNRRRFRLCGSADEQAHQSREKSFRFDRLETGAANWRPVGNLRATFLAEPCHGCMAYIAVRCEAQDQRGLPNSSDLAAAGHSC